MSGPNKQSIMTSNGNHLPQIILLQEVIKLVDDKKL